MSYLFDSAQSQYCKIEQAIRNALPITLSCWTSFNSVGGGRNLFGQVTASAPANSQAYILHNGSNLKEAQASISGTGGATVGSTTYATATGVWYLQTAVFAGDTARSIYLNAGGKNSSTASAIPLGTWNRTAIGARAYNSYLDSFFSGYMAHVAMWDIALDDSQVLELLTKAPNLVMPQNLVAYWPMLDDLPTLVDIVGGKNMQILGPTWSNYNPPIEVALGPPGISGVTATHSTEQYTVSGANFGDVEGTVSIAGVAQSVDSWVDNSIVCTCARGTLKYGDYDLTVTRDDSEFAVYPVTLLPQTGWLFTDLAGTMAPPANRLTATPTDLIAGTQVAYGVTAGTGAAEVYIDGSFVVDATVTTLSAEANDGTGWGATGAQTINEVAGVAPIITTVALGTLQTLIPYSLQLVATGSVPITWALFAGAIPAGLVLDDTGLLHGTPTNPGAAYNFTVEASNAEGSDTQVYTGNVNQLPEFTGSTIPLLRVGVPFSQQVQYAGYPVPTFTVQAGAMPAGLTLSSGGLVSGTPTTAGPYSVTMRATNVAGFADRVVSDDVQPAFAIPVITTTVLGPMGVNTPFSEQIVATGNPTPTFALNGGSLPAGLTLETSGLLHGTPTTAGAYSFTVTATNSEGLDSQLFTGSVSAALVAPIITTTVLNELKAGVVFSQQVAATGNPAPTFATFAGSVAGLSINASGLITGTPTTAGAYSWTIRATNSQGTDDQVFTGSVAAADVPPIINGAPLPTFFVGVPYNETIPVTQGTPPITFTLQGGSLPAGISLASDGTLSGTPTTGGAYSFTARATNAQGFDDQLFTGTVSNALAPPIITTTVLAPMYVGIAFSQLIQCTGNPAPTLALNAGTLPAGLTLDTTGLLHGTPTTAAAYNFTVVATNSQGVDPQVFTGSVLAAPAVPPNATLQEAILIVTGGPTVNSGLMKWFAARGGIGTTYNDLERSFLVNEGMAAGMTTAGMWMKYLTDLGYAGTIDDMFLRFWRDGGV